MYSTVRVYQMRTHIIQIVLSFPAKLLLGKRHVGVNSSYISAPSSNNFIRHLSYRKSTVLYRYDRILHLRNTDIRGMN